MAVQRDGFTNVVASICNKSRLSRDDQCWVACKNSRIVESRPGRRNCSTLVGHQILLPGFRVLLKTILAICVLPLSLFCQRNFKHCKRTGPTCRDSVLNRCSYLIS
jgi:hypothetical protein